MAKNDGNASSGTMKEERACGSPGGGEEGSGKDHERLLCTMEGKARGEKKSNRGKKGIFPRAASNRVLVDVQEEDIKRNGRNVSCRFSGINTMPKRKTRRKIFREEEAKGGGTFS